MTSASAASVLCVVGARPNFIKIAPIIRALKQTKYDLSTPLLHTGQHYDAVMKRNFFEQLQIPEPDIDLCVGSGSHAMQTAEIMKRFEPVLDDLKPDAVLVVGDVNSTIACSLVAAKKNTPIIHVEAGLRSGDRRMPEEINRVLTDHISELLFTSERLADKNLIAEGISPSRIHFAGNVMIDSLMFCLERAVPAELTLAGANWSFGLADTRRRYGLVTLHRPSNVDDPETLERVLTTLTQISREIPLVFPLHPRTEKRIAESGLEELISKGNWLIVPPLGYLEMLGLMKAALFVLTDSGGIQEETTALGVPCITLRESTERPITVELGTNTVAGTDPERIIACFQDVVNSGGKSGQIPDLWDGQAAERIANVVHAWLQGCV